MGKKKDSEPSVIEEVEKFTNKYLLHSDRVCGIVFS